MSNESKQKQTKQAPVPLHVEMNMRSFPVAFMKANPNNDFWVCGQVKSSITANPERPKNQRHFWMEFVPDLQSVAVWYQEVNQEPMVEYVPIAQVRTWAPLQVPK